MEAVSPFKGDRPSCCSGSVRPCVPWCYTPRPHCRNLPQLGWQDQRARSLVHEETCSAGWWREVLMTSAWMMAEKWVLLPSPTTAQGRVLGVPTARLAGHGAVLFRALLSQASPFAVFPLPVTARTGAVAAEVGALLIDSEAIDSGDIRGGGHHGNEVRSAEQKEVGERGAKVRPIDARRARRLGVVYVLAHGAIHVDSVVARQV
mmetsp:Transcript_33256/g.96343  ORF Transcript_33256/g.96343 Transcript_33256/m.96343 type:complete len:205 (+) Transcript_33256:651-1265(+)